MPYHTRTWLLWLLAAALAAGSTRNPAYLAIILVAARVVDSAVRAGQAAIPTSEEGYKINKNYFIIFIYFIFSSLFNFLIAHVGTTVLIRLPEEWPLVGGILTAEGLAYGLLNGLSLITLLAVFLTFNAGVDPYALLRLVPAGFAQAGLVTAIAIAYVPQTLARLGEIREAQALRGHRVRGVRDLGPLAVPLLSGGLERAIALAEAMEARGFTPAPAGDAPGKVQSFHKDDIKKDDIRIKNLFHKFLILISSLMTILRRWVLIGGVLAGLVGGFLLAYYPRQPLGGGIVLASGLIAIISALARAPHPPRTTYRRAAWRRRDMSVSLALLGVAALVGGVDLLGRGLWLYTPYPTLAWPPFDPLLGLALAALIAPALPLLRDGGRGLGVGG
jgi:energy-coupling factor transport system permease protein